MCRASAASRLGEGHPVEAQDQQFSGRGRGEDLVEADFERRVGHHVQPQGGLAHLADASPERGHVLGAKVGVVREGGLEFVDRLGGDPRGEDLVQPFEGVMIAFESGDAGLDPKAGGSWPG